MVDLIFRTERTVAGVRETHAQRFMHVRHVVQKRSTGTLVTVSRTTSVHVEEGERAETVSGQTGHQRDDVQALSLNLRGHSQFSRRGGLARKVQT